MTPRLKYQIGTGLLALCFFLLIVEVLEMTSVIRAIVSTREMNIVAIVCLIGAIGMRRQGRQGMAGQG